MKCFPYLFLVFSGVQVLHLDLLSPREGEREDGGENLYSYKTISREIIIIKTPKEEKKGNAQT